MATIPAAVEDKLTALRALLEQDGCPECGPGFPGWTTGSDGGVPVQVECETCGRQRWLLDAARALHPEVKLVVPPPTTGDDDDLPF